MALPHASRPVAFSRAAGVAALWALSAIPTILQPRCPVAALLHLPCPGCGMTRALRLLAAGHVEASLRLQPLVVPVLVAAALLAVASVHATLALGTPLETHRTRLGRAAIGLGIAAYGVTVALWGLRWFGLFGGPVPVG